MTSMNTLLLLVLLFANISLANGRVAKQRPPTNDLESTDKKFPKVESRTYLSDPHRKWPNATVYYEMPSGMSNLCKTIFKREMSNIQNKTCIKFKPRSAEPNYVKFNYKKDYCISKLGKTGGMQVLDYNDGCCVKNKVQHVLLHLLGGVHEYVRPDRDQYILVNMGNIKPGFWSQFYKYQKGIVNTYNQSFDYKSVMMHNSWKFSNRWSNLDAIWKKKGYTGIPHESEMSNTDWYKLKKHYCS